MKNNEIKIKEMIDDMFKNGDFIIFRGDIGNLGPQDGDEGMVVGSQSLPFDENDIYNLRMHFLVHPVDGDHVDATKMLLTDPKNLELVGTRRTEHLKEMLTIDFGVKTEEVVNETVN